MKKGICVFAFALAFVAGSTSARANSIWTIDGDVSGIELCPQYICGAAIFAAGFQGQVGHNPSASGLIVAALNHDDLNEDIDGDCTTIFGGTWELRTLFRRIRGIVLGGTLVYHPASNTFDVKALLHTDHGNSLFNGTLDHNPLIPRIQGYISSTSSSTPDSCGP